MTTSVIDTLSISKQLQSAGYTQQQAEAQAKIWSEVIEDNIATKRDLKELETSVKRDMRDLEYRLTIRLGSMMVVAVGIIAALVKVL